MPLYCFSITAFAEMRQNSICYNALAIAFVCIVVVALQNRNRRLSQLLTSPILGEWRTVPLEPIVVDTEPRWNLDSNATVLPTVINPESWPINREKSEEVMCSLLHPPL